MTTTDFCVESDLTFAWSQTLFLVWNTARFCVVSDFFAWCRALFLFFA